MSISDCQLLNWIKYFHIKYIESFVCGCEFLFVRRREQEIDEGLRYSLHVRR